MSDTLYYLASAAFESACQIGILPKEHPAANLHGHSYTTSIRLPSHSIQQADPLNLLTKRLADTVEPLNYSFLNDQLAIPTDENLSRWIHAHLDFPGIDRVAVQSTIDSGVDLDHKGDAHIWRRYRFEAAHQLPNVPAGHQCGRMHGHGFEVILHANQSLDANTNMGIDFSQMDAFWQPLHKQLDYHCLNDIVGLENPTSEMLALWIWERLKPEFEQLSWVTVYETHTSGCHYNGQAYRIWKEQRFESALQLKQVSKQDKRRRLHGHSYLIRLHLTAELDQIMGWTIDYGDIKDHFKPIYAQLDHRQLDQLDDLKEANITELLFWIKNQIAFDLPELDRLDLFETPGCGAILCWGDEGPALPD